MKLDYLKSLIALCVFNILGEIVAFSLPNKLLAYYGDDADVWIEDREGMSLLQYVRKDHGEVLYGLSFRVPSNCMEVVFNNGMRGMDLRYNAGIIQIWIRHDIDIKKTEIRTKIEKKFSQFQPEYLSFYGSCHHPKMEIRGNYANLVIVPHNKAQLKKCLLLSCLLI